MLTKLAAAAVAVAAPAYTVFRPQGYNSLQHLDEGRGPDPLQLVLHLTQVATESDLCQGVNDVLTLTLPAPITGRVSPTDFYTAVCTTIKDGDFSPLPRCVGVIPSCARLQLDGQPQERRTVLLFGQFVKFEGRNATLAIQNFTIHSVTFLIDGKQVSVYGQYNSGQGFGRAWQQGESHPVEGYAEGPFLADATLLNLSQPLHSAAADPNGCAARHPSATHAARLLFASAMHERAADGSLAPFTTNAIAAAALFSLRMGGDGAETSPDRVVGVAGAAGGSAVDVCIEGVAAEPQVQAVVINCTASAPLSPAGFACDQPIMAFFTTWADGRAGRDPATFAAGHTIEFCISASGDCPGTAPDHHDDYDHHDADYDDDHRRGDYDRDDPDYDDGGDDAEGRRSGSSGPRFGFDMAAVVAGAGAVVAAGAVLAVLGIAGVV